jgi:caa(3)-type oxidase subunit IV
MSQTHEKYHSHHIIPFNTYVAVFATLIFLTIVTVGVATPVTGVDFGILNTFIAMLIATVKAQRIVSAIIKTALPLQPSASSYGVTICS